MEVEEPADAYELLQNMRLEDEVFDFSHSPISPICYTPFSLHITSIYFLGLARDLVPPRMRRAPGGRDFDRARRAQARHRTRRERGVCALREGMAHAARRAEGRGGSGSRRAEIEIPKIILEHRETCHTKINRQGLILYLYT